MWFQRRPDNKSGEEASKALEESQEQLKEVQNLGAEVTALSSAIKRIHERNHFSEKLEELILQARGSHR